MTSGRTYRAWVWVVLRGQAFDALRLLQDAQRPVDHLLAGGGDTGEIAALAHENLEAELILQQLDLLADARLGGMQLLGGCRDVQPTLGNGREIAQLVKLHGVEA